MENWNVIYREDSHGFLDFDIFQCQAEDMDHADDQCRNAYPDCEILWADTEADEEETIKNWLSVSIEG